MRAFGGFSGFLSGCVNSLADAVLPPLCLSCAAPLVGRTMLCAGCWSHIHFLGAPNCGLCGLPFEFEQGPEMLCARCVAQRPAFDRARAVFCYDEASKPLVLGFKHGDRTEAATAFGRWLARAGAEFKGPDAVIAPVPLHWSRLLARKYNQAALLAEALHRTWEGEGVLVPDLLIRERATPPQGRLAISRRRKNVRGAFAINRRRGKIARGRRVILVDDVMTTGATVETAASVLKRAGAGAVDVLVLARVLLPAS
jgi:ComF family protein